MSTRYGNKIVFYENKISHPFIDMEGVEQVSYSLDNDLVRNYLNNVTYSRTDIITTKNTKSTAITNINPYFHGKTNRKPWGSSTSTWSETGRPVVISGTKAGDTIIFTSLDYSTTVHASEGATLVYNLIPRRFYEYKIKRGNTVIETKYFFGEGQCRMIRIPIPNFRDIGGWKCEGGTVSYDKVFRGCGIVGIDGSYVNLRNATNKAEVVAALLKLGITDELDLRAPNDGSQSAEDPEYGDAAITYTNIPTGAYLINSNTVRALLHISGVLSNNGKVWLHCHTGADRAGTLVMLVQILLGCDIDSVIKEWELSMFNGNGYDQTYLENTNFRTFLYNQYKANTSKTLYENIVTTIKNNKPSGVTNDDIDAMIANFRSRMVTKTMAIVGDSYSGYYGSGPKVKIGEYGHPYAGEYPDPNPMSINSIWWAIVAQHFGWSVANYSWSGCTVTPGEVLDERIGCSDERINRLCYLTGGVAPDIIVCELGMNDARFVDVYSGFTWSAIENAYRTMLTKIITAYPNAKVYCINCIHRSSGDSLYTKYNTFNTNLVALLEDYPDVTLIDAADVFNYTSTGNTVSDSTHPNAAGFHKIAQRVISVIEASQPSPAPPEPEPEPEPGEDTDSSGSYTFTMKAGQPSTSECIIRKYNAVYANKYGFLEIAVNPGDVVAIQLPVRTYCWCFESAEGLYNRVAGNTDITDSNGILEWYIGYGVNGLNTYTVKNANTTKLLIAVILLDTDALLVQDTVITVN